MADKFDEIGVDGLFDMYKQMEAQRKIGLTNVINSFLDENKGLRRKLSGEAIHSLSNGSADNDVAKGVLHKTGYAGLLTFLDYIKQKNFILTPAEQKVITEVHQTLQSQEIEKAYEQVRINPLTSRNY